MSASDKNCASCGSAFNYGVFGSNLPLGQADLKAINVAFGEDLAQACVKCRGKVLPEAKQRLDTGIVQLRNKILKGCQEIHLVSIPPLPGWQVEIVGLITAQSTTGTGAVSDLTNAVTDLFGTQSKRYNAKLRHGEDLCRTNLRLQAMDLGANAIVGIDVDYAEVGGQRAMLMVCMTGTAVRIVSGMPGLDALDTKLAELRSAQSQLNRLEDAKASLVQSL